METSWVVNFLTKSNTGFLKSCKGSQSKNNWLLQVDTRVSDTNYIARIILWSKRTLWVGGKKKIVYFFRVYSRSVSGRITSSSPQTQYYCVLCYHCENPMYIHIPTQIEIYYVDRLRSQFISAAQTAFLFFFLQ